MNRSHLVFTPARGLVPLRARLTVAHLSLEPEYFIVHIFIILNQDISLSLARMILEKLQHRAGTTVLITGQAVARFAERNSDN